MRLTTAMILTGVVLALGSGCASDYNGHGISYGCDGSGAGVVIRWGPSAQRGARAGGYEGIMQPYRWQTGAGFAVDHMSSPTYKRNVAKGLADKVAKHRSKYPDDPVYLGGLSAGCAVVIYALEQLPESVSVDQVFLLSSSVSADYDLTKALKHVRGKIYAFTSSRDTVLSGLAAKAGTADGRKVGTDISGIRGFRPPAGASRELYRKVKNIAWRPEFAQYGHNGGHTDVVASKFVARYIAPLMKSAAGGAGQ